MVEDINLVEKLAELEHEQWAHWMRYLFSKCNKESYINGDEEEVETGNLTILLKDVEHWQNQMDTNYSALTPTEKESDREWARKVLRIIEEDRN